MTNKKLIAVALGLVASSSQVTFAAAALEEVIVTAQKTEETIQSIPISIQALDSKALENNSVNSFSDVKTLIPSLKFQSYPTADQNLLITLRGIAPSALELTQDTPTAVHINGVYIARGNGLNMAVADLERIEVLRGPQGTLYGRNATAGAINIITAKPTDSFTFKQQLTFAERDQILSKTTVNVPLSETVFAKLSYLYDNKEGFVSNSAPNGIDFGDRNAQAARFDLRWQPTSDLTVDYGYDREYERYYSTPGQCLVAGTGALSAAMDQSQCSDSFKDKLAYRGHAPKNTILVDGHALNVEWEIDRSLTLRSITGYRTLDDKYYGVLLGGGAGASNLMAGTVDVNYPGLYSLPAQADHTKQHQFSQEFQLVGDFGEHVSYTTGLYYFNEKGSERQPRVSEVNIPNALGPGTGVNIDTGPRDLSGVVNESKAIFGQLTWTPPVLDGNLDIVPGIRYTRDSRKANLYQHDLDVWLINGAPPTGPVQSMFTTIETSPGSGKPVEFNKDFSKTSPSLTVQYHVNADILTYAKYVKGYQSGGTAVRSSTKEAFAAGFSPETLTSIELGVKSSWLDQRLRVNADVFQSKFKDQQITVISSSNGSAAPKSDEVNAGRSTYEGAELEIQAALTEDLRVSANYAYLHFKYDTVSNDIADPGHSYDVTNLFHNIVPTNSYSLSADYSPDIISFGKLAFNLNYSYTDAAGGWTDPSTITGSNPAPGQTPHTLIPGTPQLRRNNVSDSYGIWNGRISISEIKVGSGDKGNFTTALWCRNIADKQYLNFRSVFLADAAASSGFWGEPRTVGVDFIYSYN
ncbi:MAG TPA: TonB-dependent receptor [Spongiibacteraceae bacterium]|jgi:iron complex outermembrane receptor protein